MSDMSLADVISTQRSVREFTDLPVEDGVLRRIMELATKAPNGGNNQGWRFLIVRDSEQRRRLGELYIESAKEQWGGDLGAVLASGEVGDLQRPLVEMIRDMPHKPPVQLLACFERQNAYDPAPSIYPAVQNLMLAAWSFGLGTVLTTALQRTRDKEVREVLSIPEDILIYAFIPMGYPARPYGRPRRKPVQEVTFFDHWGSRAGWE